MKLPIYDNPEDLKIIQELGLVGEAMEAVIRSEPELDPAKHGRADALTIVGVTSLRIILRHSSRYEDRNSGWMSNTYESIPYHRILHCSMGITELQDKKAGTESSQYSVTILAFHDDREYRWRQLLRRDAIDAQKVRQIHDLITCPYRLD